jgi:hypothetical protein
VTTTAEAEAVATNEAPLIGNYLFYDLVWKTERSCVHVQMSPEQGVKLRGLLFTWSAGQLWQIQLGWP